MKNKRTSVATAEKNPSKRCRYKWVLRSLVVFGLLLAIGASWLVVTMRDLRRQKAAAEEIRMAGGVPGYLPTWLGRLLRDDSLVRVRSVALSGDGAKEATLAHLEELSELRTLVLEGPQVTDSGLVHIEGLSRLRALWLDGSGITDAGLTHIEGLPRLEFLFVNDTQITDAGLAHLEGLTRLQWLDVSNTKVTYRGLRRLQRALPKCIIRTQPGG